MSTDADNKFWEEHAPKLRDFAKLRPLTPEEAEEEARIAPSVPSRAKRYANLSRPPRTAHPRTIPPNTTG